MSDPKPPGDDDKKDRTTPEVQVPQPLVVNRPETWRPDPGLSTGHGQADGPLAAVELANFGVPVTGLEEIETGPNPMSPEAGLSASAAVDETLQMPPVRRPAMNRGALDDTQSVTPVTDRPGPGDSDETIPLPPVRRPAVVRDEPDETRPLPPHAGRPVRSERDESRDLTPVSSLEEAVSSGGDRESARRDRMVAGALLVAGLALVAAVFVKLTGGEPEPQRRGGNFSQAGPGGSGIGPGGRKGGAGGGGGGITGRTADSEQYVKVAASAADLCVSHCARRQARCAQSCKKNGRCREQCVDTLMVCENECGAAKAEAPTEAGPRRNDLPGTTLSAEQLAAAKKMCRDDDGAIVACPHQEEMMGRAREMVKRMCGAPDFPCPE